MAHPIRRPDPAATDLGWLNYRLMVVDVLEGYATETSGAFW